MTSAECASGCGESSPDATICKKCTAALRGTLELAASIEVDLAYAAARLLVPGSGGRSTATEQPLPYDPVATQAARALRLALARAVGQVAAATPPGSQLPARHAIAPMARWLHGRLDHLRRHPDVGEIYHDIRRVVDRAAAALDAPPELHPAGECGKCGAPLLAKPGADTVTCRKCGTTHEGIRAWRTAGVAQAERIETATVIAGMLSRMGINVDAGTIRKWASRGRLAQRPGPGDDPCYALSDVLALIAERDERNASAR